MQKLPILHITDLYHPPQDPDDQIDLATILGLEEFDLKAVVIDSTERFLAGKPAGYDIPREPGLVLVTQLAYLTGKTIPAAIGPTRELTCPGDDARDRPAREQAGVQLILDTLESSKVPVTISCVGSARALTAAINRAPDLMRKKTRAILLNAGSTGGPKREWNVDLDPAAYIGLWRSGLPIHWYPCGTETGSFHPDHERGTFWSVRHEDLFKNLPDALRKWFAYGLTGCARGDFLRALDETGHGAVWEQVLAASRNLWSTASLVMAAGRLLAKQPEGWRFVSRNEVDPEDIIWPLRLDPIRAKVSDNAHVDWVLDEHAENACLFGRQPGVEYGVAMAGALNALWRKIRL